MWTFTTLARLSGRTTPKDGPTSTRSSGISEMETRTVPAEPNAKAHRIIARELLRATCVDDREACHPTHVVSSLKVIYISRRAFLKTMTSLLGRFLAALARHSCCCSHVRHPDLRKRPLLHANGQNIHIKLS